jgi:hypothetical protein
MINRDITPKLNEALAKAQGSFPTVEKNRTAKVMKDGRLLYEFDYADLADIEVAIRKPLSENGLAIVHQIAPLERSRDLILKTQLRHSSGEQIESSMILAVPAGRPQDLGGLLTYFKRYLVSALISISAEQDVDGANDGNEREIKSKPPAEKAAPKPQSKTKPAEEPPKTEAPAQAPKVSEMLRRLTEAIKKAKWSQEMAKEYAKTAFGKESPGDLTDTEILGFIAATRSASFEEALFNLQPEPDFDDPKSAQAGQDHGED